MINPKRRVAYLSKGFDKKPFECNVNSYEPKLTHNNLNSSNVLHCFSESIAFEKADKKTIDTNKLSAFRTRE